MDLFSRQLKAHQPSSKGRRWLFIPADQLSDGIGPLSRENPGTIGLILVQSHEYLSRRPYHQQKLAILLANMRHFALEQAARNVAVRYVETDQSLADTLEILAKELGMIRMMHPAEWELRQELKPLVRSRMLDLLPHEGWLTTHERFLESAGKRGSWRMDRFYRHIRNESKILMPGGKPAGGKYSFDSETRRPWKGQPVPPSPPVFPRDPIKEEVVQLIRKSFSHHPGRLDLDSLPATTADAERLWEWAKSKCLTFFGPYQDAMSRRSTGLFHTRISALLNIHRLLPRRVVQDVEKLRIPMASKEGFIRQVLGWREFVFHVHLETDGFRHLPSVSVRQTPAPGDGGYGRWAGRKWPARRLPKGMAGGAAPDALGATNHLPPSFWGEPSGLGCLDRIVADVWTEGYSHHITRLMVLANLATLMDVNPRELTDWFWAAYIDAYDWVVEPNVLGMGTFALGELMTTKPYVAGTAYLERMSDYCEECSFDPQRDCPITRLYWAFLARHQRPLAAVARLRMPFAALRKRDRHRRENDQAVFRLVASHLADGRTVSPADLRPFQD